MSLNEKRIKQIDEKTAKILSSGQVITSVANVVKELLENSIDAKSTVITIRIKELGKESIEVTDNGFGIDDTDFESLAKRHFTSKLSQFEDLSTISSFGFRGEALNSLCNLAEVSIQTRHLSQSIGTQLKFNSEAIIVSREPIARNIGTTVLVKNLFHNMPVRRKELYKNIKREFDKMNRLVYGYCVGTVGRRITLTNQMANKCKQTLLSSPGLSIKNNIIEVFDSKQLNCLIDFQQNIESNEQSSCDPNVRISGLISKCDSGCGRSATDRQFFYVNQRSCEYKSLQKFVNDIYRSYNRTQFPFVLLDIRINKSCVDFNVCPDKRQLLVSNEEQIFAIIKESLNKMYNKESSCSLDSMTNYTIKGSLFSQKRHIDEVDEEVNRITSCSLKMSRCRSPCDSPFKATTSCDSTANTPPIRQLFDSSSSDKQIEKPKSFTTALNVMNANVVEKPQFVEKLKLNSDNSRTNSWSEKQQNVCSSSASVADIPVIVRDVSIGSTENRIIIDKEVEKSADINSDSGVKKKKCLTEIEIVVESDEEENDTKDKTNKLIKDETNDLIVDIDIDSIIDLFRKSIAIKVLPKEHKFSAKISSSQNERAENELIHELKKNCFEEMQIIGQFNLGFIVTKLGTDLFVVDQHASNERFNYERLLATTPIENQNLVLPMPLELSSANEMVVIDNLDLFRRLGFGVVLDDNASPSHRICLSALPISKEWTAGKDDIEEIIGTIIETPIELLGDYKLNGFKKVIASRACRSSVMIGEPLLKTQMKTIVSQMSELMNPWHCAHNRPTIRHLVNLIDIYSLSNN